MRGTKKWESGEGEGQMSCKGDRFNGGMQQGKSREMEMEI